MEIPRRVAFSIQGKGTADGLCYVRLRLSMPRQGRHEWTLRNKIEAKEWDAAGGCPIGRTRAATAVSREMRQSEDTLREVFTRYELIEKRTPALSEVVKEFDEATGRMSSTQQARHGLRPILEKLIEERCARHSLTDGTRKIFHSLMFSLKSYAPDATVEDVTKDWVVGFSDFLLEQGLCNNTIKTKLTLLKMLLRTMRSNGQLLSDAPLNADIHLRGGKRYESLVFLTVEELKAFEAADLSDSPHLSETRDAFVFCCYTGLRFSDVKKLKWSDVTGGHVSVVTQKTSTALTIELNDHSAAILGKRQRGASDSLIFRLPCVMVANTHLKTIGRTLHLDTPVRRVKFKGARREEMVFKKWELLSSHCARRTFVVTALQLGISAEVIMRWTGHSKYEAMKPYISIVDELKRREMAKFNGL